MSTGNRQFHISYARPIQSINSQTQPFVFLEGQFLCLGIPSLLFPSGFPNKIFCAPHLYPIYSTCPTNFTILDLITRIITGEYYKSWSFPSLQSFALPCYLFPLGPNVFLSTLLSNTLRPCSSLIKTDQV